MERFCNKTIIHLVRFYITHLPITVANLIVILK